MDLRRKNLRRRGNRVKDNRSRTSALEKIDRLEWVDSGLSRSLDDVLVPRRFEPFAF